MKKIFSLSKHKRIFIGFIIIIVLVVAAFNFLKPKTTQVVARTSTVEKGTIVLTVSGSGTISSANSASIQTSASGVVSQIYVQDGASVQTGDKIAEINLDLDGQQNEKSAYSSFLSAKNNLESAKTAFLTLQSAMFTSWDKFKLMAESTKYQQADGSPRTDQRYLAEFNIANDDWLATEQKYKNQESVVSQAESAYASAWMTYQQASGVIYAPISGTVSGLSLQVGSVISQNTSSSTTSVSKTKIANVVTDAMPSVSINLTEIDVPKIKIGDRATVTLDAISDKTFTGEVFSLDTVGSVSSGVTTYPCVIRLDTKSNEILPNMAASANIIVNTKNDVLIVPSSAIRITNGVSSVTLVKNGVQTSATVEIGLQSDTESEITSGLKEGDKILTTQSTKTSTSSSGQGQSSSPFSSFGGGGVRMAR